MIDANYKNWEFLKQRYPDAILLMRQGEMYETYFDDAIAVAKTCVTVFGMPADERDPAYCWFPYNKIEEYLPMLVKAGHRVALCDQLENPKKPVIKKKKKVEEINIGCNVKLKE